MATITTTEASPPDSPLGAAAMKAKQRYARAPHLWALGVGAVVSGNFFGWQAALVAGFDGLLVTLSVVTVLYVLLSFSIAELSTMLPTGGGPYVFALHGMGHSAAFFAGLAESLKVVATCAVANVGIGSYLNQLIGCSSAFGPLWWAIMYCVFVLLNISGVQMSFGIQLVATLFSLMLLLVFYVGAATQISYDQWVAQQHWQFPDGFEGIIKGFSFTLWFYLGIEELPLAVEETIEPSKNMPLGLLSSISSLVAISFCTVIFNSMISPGAAQMAVSTSPLLDGYKSVFGDNRTTSGFTWLLTVGLICSFHSFIFCMGKLLFAIARDGYFPSMLTNLHSTRGTPYVALITGAGIGMVVATALHYIIGDARLGSVLIDLALLGALTSYAFQLTAFICLRQNEPDRDRPYRSPFGVPGAVLGLVLCVFTFGTIIYNGASDTDFLLSIVVAVLVFAAGAAYFFYSVKPKQDDVARQESAAAMRENLLQEVEQGHGSGDKL